MRQLASRTGYRVFVSGSVAGPGVPRQMVLKVLVSRKGEEQYSVSEFRYFFILRIIIIMIINDDYDNNNNKNKEDSYPKLSVNTRTNVAQER